MAYLSFYHEYISRDRIVILIFIVGLFIFKFIDQHLRYSTAFVISLIIPFCFFESKGIICTACPCLYAYIRNLKSSLQSSSLLISYCNIITSLITFSIFYLIVPVSYMSPIIQFLCPPVVVVWISIQSLMALDLSHYMHNLSTRETKIPLIFSTYLRIDNNQRAKRILLNLLYFLISSLCLWFQYISNGINNLYVSIFVILVSLLPLFSKGLLIPSLFIFICSLSLSQSHKLLLSQIDNNSTNNSYQYQYLDSLLWSILFVMTIIWSTNNKSSLMTMSNQMLSVSKKLRQWMFLYNTNINNNNSDEGTESNIEENSNLIDKYYNNNYHLLIINCSINKI